MNIQNTLLSGVEKLNNNRIENANLKAKIILAFILNANKEYLIINNKQELKNEQIEKFNKYVNMLIGGIPIQYITNKQEFMGLEFYVDDNVLIPQPDTEILVQEAVDICREKEQIKILDLCTGSGAIAVSIAKYMSYDVGVGVTHDPHITATDISEKAIEIAKKNAIKHNVQNNIKFVKSDMFENIQDKFNVIVSNPPYIETEIITTLSKEVQNEPTIALDGGQDGLEFYKIIANEAYKYLNNEGILIIEIGYNQKEKVIKLLEDTNKYDNIECKKDFSNNNRCIICNYAAKR